MRNCPIFLTVGRSYSVPCARCCCFLFPLLGQISSDWPGAGCLRFRQWAQRTCGEGKEGERGRNANIGSSKTFLFERQAFYVLPIIHTDTRSAVAKAHVVAQTFSFWCCFLLPVPVWISQDPCFGLFGERTCAPATVEAKTMRIEENALYHRNQDLTSSPSSPSHLFPRVSSHVVSFHRFFSLPT